MSRRPSHLQLPVLLLTLMIAGAVRSSAQEPLIQRATADPVRQTRSAAWLDYLDTQTPALLQAIGELDRERDNWRASPGTARCRRARRALSEVDRGGLLEVADYRLVSAVGNALDELDGAVRACLERRYFELDYRLDLARRSLDRAREQAREQTRR